MRVNIIKKRLMSFACEKTSCISLSSKSFPVQYREYESGLLTKFIYLVCYKINEYSVLVSPN